MSRGIFAVRWGRVGSDAVLIRSLHSCSDRCRVARAIGLATLDHTCMQPLTIAVTFVFVLAARPANPQECQATDNLWVCLICGSVLCGSRHEDHVGGHYTSTLHAYAIEIGVILCISFPFFHHQLRIGRLPSVDSMPSRGRWV